jgi:hypothetical protein
VQAVSACHGTPSDVICPLNLFFCAAINRV